MPSKKLPGQDMADLINRINQPLASVDRMAELGRRITQGLEGYRLAIQPDLAVLLEDRFRLPTTELGRAFAAITPPPLSEAVTKQLQQVAASVNGVLDMQRYAVKDMLPLIQQAMGAQLPSREAIDGIAEAFRRLTPDFPALELATIEGSLPLDTSAAIERFQTRAIAMAEAPTATAEDVEALVSDAEALTAAAPIAVKDSLNEWMVRVWWWLLGVALEDPVKEAIRQALAAVVMLAMLVLPAAVNRPPALPPAHAASPLLLPAPLPVDAGALTIPGGWQIEGLPTVIRRAGPKAERVTVEFFTAQIRNRNTRQAYAHATTRFFNWCEERNLELADITPFAVAAYVEELQREASAPTVKQHLAGIRMLFDALVVGQVLPMNPAASVRGPKHVVKRGRTPVLAAQEARALLDAIDTSTLAALRDRALIGVMVYSFARVSAAVAMRVEDYYPAGKRWWLRLHEKGGKRHDVPAHHNAEAYLDVYLDSAGIREEKRGPLFRSLGRDRRLTHNPMHRVDVLRMVKRRALAAGLPASTCCHTFRATGITAYLENGGTIEKAQQIAAHESPRTTKLYDRTNDELTLDEIERIVI